MECNLRDMFIKDKGIVYIYGAGPSLRRVTKLKEGLHLVINSAMYRFNTIKGSILFCDKRFFQGNQQKIYSFLEGNKGVFPQCLWSKELEGNAFKYHPSHRVVKEKEQNSLMVGHSTLIPALHFALLLKPDKIVIHGVDLDNRLHWNDNIRYCRPRIFNKVFPAQLKIIKEIQILLNSFKEVPVLSGNSESVLVEKGVLKFESNNIR